MSGELETIFEGHPPQKPARKTEGPDTGNIHRMGRVWLGLPSVVLGGLLGDKVLLGRRVIVITSRGIPHGGTSIGSSFTVLVSGLIVVAIFIVGVIIEEKFAFRRREILKEVRDILLALQENLDEVGGKIFVPFIVE